MTEAIKTAVVKSWKTTLAAVLGAVSVLSVNVSYALDADPATLADWGAVVGAVVFAAGLIAARDNDVSSEAAGA